MGSQTVEIRQLPPEEWARLTEIYQSQADQLPPSEHNTAIVAEIQGRIVGMFGINLIAHAGPIWVDPEWRGTGISQRMGAALDELIRNSGGKGYLMFPSNRGSELVAIRLGLRPRHVKVYQREY